MSPSTRKVGAHRKAGLRLPPAVLPALVPEAATVPSSIPASSPATATGESKREALQERCTQQSKHGDWGERGAVVVVYRKGTRH